MSAGGCEIGYIKNVVGLAFVPSSNVTQSSFLDTLQVAIDGFVDIPPNCSIFLDVGLGMGLEYIQS